MRWDTDNEWRTCGKSDKLSDNKLLKKATTPCSWALLRSCSFCNFLVNGYSLLAAHSDETRGGGFADPTYRRLMCVGSICVAHGGRIPQRREGVSAPAPRVSSVDAVPPEISLLCCDVTAHRGTSRTTFTLTTVSRISWSRSIGPLKQNNIHSVRFMASRKGHMAKLINYVHVSCYITPFLHAMHLLL